MLHFHLFHIALTLDEIYGSFILSFDWFTLLALYFWGGGGVFWLHPFSCLNYSLPLVVRLHTDTTPDCQLAFFFWVLRVVVGKILRCITMVIIVRFTCWHILTIVICQWHVLSYGSTNCVFSCLSVDGLLCLGQTSKLLLNFSCYVGLKFFFIRRVQLCGFVCRTQFLCSPPSASQLSSVSESA